MCYQMLNISGGNGAGRDYGSGRGAGWRAAKGETGATVIAQTIQCFFL